MRQLSGLGPPSSGWERSSVPCASIARGMRHAQVSNYEGFPCELALNFKSWSHPNSSGWWVHAPFFKQTEEQTATRPQKKKTQNSRKRKQPKTKQPQKKHKAHIILSGPCGPDTSPGAIEAAASRRRPEPRAPRGADPSRACSRGGPPSAPSGAGGQGRTPRPALSSAL